LALFRAPTGLDFKAISPAKRPHKRILARKNEIDAVICALDARYWDSTPGNMSAIPWMQESQTCSWVAG
jgi:hypothetical protein